MCFWSHETTAYARPIDEELEQRDLRSECQTVAGTALYDSASWNSSGSRVVGEPEPELESEPKSAGVPQLERKFSKGVKS